MEIGYSSSSSSSSFRKRTKQIRVWEALKRGIKALVIQRKGGCGKQGFL
jgi:hypothetical protein